VLPTKKTCENLANRVETHLLEHLAPFWTGPALDPVCGGWHAWLTNELQPDRTKPQGLIVNCRILWAFSALSRAFPNPEFRALAERAFDLVMKRFWDTEYGGAFWRLDNDWRLLDDAKKTYGQAFYLYALSEYHLAFGNEAAINRARELWQILETQARDSANEGYWEVRRRDWGEAVDGRLSDKDMDEKKSMNNHLHVLEAYTNLYRIWPNPSVATALRRLIEIFLRRIIAAGPKAHFHHFFSEQWQVRSDSRTYGHDIEGSWLLVEAAQALGQAELEKDVCSVAMRIADSVYCEGLAPDGALHYEGRAGRVIDAGKECWPQAEALVGFVNAWELSGEIRYFRAAERVWDFIENHLADRRYGEWFWRISPDGSHDQTLPKVSEWKGPYHGVRACLETLRRLRQS